MRTAGSVRRLAPGLRLQRGWVEGAPIIICRRWRDGDERRGLVGRPCMVTRCPRTLAVTAPTMGAGYLCLEDAEAYGLAPPGAARMASAEAAEARRHER